LELIGWLWLAIGGSHVSDRLSRPHGSKHHQRRDVESLRKLRLLGFNGHEGISKSDRILIFG